MIQARTPLLLLVAVVAMVGYCASHIELSTDITNFLPDEGASRRAALSRQLTNSELMQTMVLTIAAPTTATAIAAARELAQALRTHPEVAWLRSGMHSELIEHVYHLYFPRRYYFLSDDPERSIPLLLTDTALRQRAEALKRELAQPAAALFKRTAAADPIAGFATVMKRLSAHQPALDVEDGQFVTPDRKFAVLFLRSHASAFASRPQRRLLQDIRAAFDEIAQRFDEPLELEQSGANRFAVHAEDSIRGDVRLIATCSFVGVALVFFAFFPSLRTFLYAACPAVAGILVAATLGLIVFGRLDGLTIAFGASLIGVAIDYSIHVINHYGLAQFGVTPAAVVRRLRPSLLLGALTTMASFAGLGLTSFPGFREIAFFAIVGVGTAALATLYLLPRMLPTATAAPRVAHLVADRLGGWVGTLGRYDRTLAIVPFVVLVASAVAIPSLNWVDDLSKLTSMDPGLVEEERRVRARVARLDAGRFVVAVETDVERGVELNDQVFTRLEMARRDGAFDGMRSLHTLIWSEELQRRNWRTLASQSGLYARLQSIFARAGFRADLFAPFRDDIDTPPPPLTVADLRASPLADLLTSHVLPLGDRTAIITYLRGVRSSAAIRTVLEDLDNVYLFEQSAFMNDIYSEFRTTTMRQIFVGSALVILALAIRYRRWRPTLAAFLPSLLVAMTTLTIFATCGVETNLLHLVSLIMVMGMGVDYGIFMVDSVGSATDIGATMLSLLVSCLTTVFVFGTLALSAHPALRAIGITSGLGILLSFLYAPVALVVTGTTREQPSGSPTQAG